jgi:hypothetical protein
MKRALAPIAIAILLLAHIVLVFRSYPIDVFLAGEIPLKGDIARHFATAHASAECGGLFGYDPHFMAGYPVGLWNSMGKKGYELAHLALPMLALPRLFYLVIVGLCLLNPLLLWAALRRHAGSRNRSMILLALVLVFWHLSSQIAYFWNFGNIFFPAVSCWVVMMGAATHDVLNGRRLWLNALWLGLLATATLYCHSVALVAAAIVLLSVVGVHGLGRIGTKSWLGIGLALTVFVLLSIGWLIPLFQSRGDCLPQPKLWFQGGPKHLVMDLLSDRVYRHHFDRNFLYQFAIIVGFAGTMVSLRREGRNLVFALGLGACGVLVLTYIGHAIPPLRAIQPYRFTLPAILLLALPAAYGLDAGLKALAHCGKKERLIMFLLVAMLMPRFTASLIDLTWPTDAVGITEERRQVVEKVKQMQVRGRVLCDDIGLGHILPYTCRVPVLSGLSSQAFLKHRFAGMDEEGIVFGRKPGEWDGEALAQYLDTYAVEFAIFSDGPWLRFADRPDSPFVLVEVVAGHSIFRVRGADIDYLIDGEARVDADYNQIAIRAASGPLLLSFHYADWLTASDGVILTPEMVMDDPVPFIRATPPPGTTQFIVRRR